MGSCHFGENKVMMKHMKKFLLFLAAGVLAFAFATKAQVLTGSITASVFAGDGGVVTSSSLTMFQTNIISATTGNFAGTVPIGSILYAYTGTINGISSSSTPFSINDIVVFSDLSPGGVSGTTPPARFDFNLSTLAELPPGPSGGGASFAGFGTIVDTTGAFQATPAIFSVDFSNANNYTISIVTVPEPATITIAAAGLLGVLIIRRRKA